MFVECSTHHIYTLVKFFTLSCDDNTYFKGKYVYLKLFCIIKDSFVFQGCELGDKKE